MSKVNQERFYMIVIISIISYLLLSFVGTLETVSASDKKMNELDKSTTAKISALSTDIKLIKSGLCIIDKRTCKIKITD